MASKSPDAFRTISEVAEWLNTPAHVLRFWESKFSQVKPVKRAGGRRYYRPADMALIGGIKKLLHDDGMTIKGVQKLLREQGIKHVAALSPPLEEELEAIVEPQLHSPTHDPLPIVESPRDSDPEPGQEAGQVLSFASRDTQAAETAVPTQTADAPDPESNRANDTPDMFADIDADAENMFDADGEAVEIDSPFSDDHIGKEEMAAEAQPSAQVTEPELPAGPVSPAAPSEETEHAPESAPAAPLPAFLKKPLGDPPSPPPDTTPPVVEPADAAPEATDTASAPVSAEAEASEETTDAEAQSETPSGAEPEDASSEIAAAAADEAPAPAAAAPKPKIITTPPDPMDHETEATAGLLTALSRHIGPLPAAADDLQPLINRLRVQTDAMTNASRN